MKQTETAKLLAAIKTFFPNFEITAAVTHGWHSMLEDMSFERAQQNLAQYIKTSRFPPTIADIRCEDANQFVDYEQLRQETQIYLQEREERQQRAIDCPPHLRVAFLTAGDDADV